MKRISFLSAAFAVAFTNMGTAAVADGHAHELHKYVTNPKELSEIVNSPTMSAATSFCQHSVHVHYKTHKLMPKSFVELNAHCLSGNFHHVASQLGQVVKDKKYVGSLEFSDGVLKNLSKNEQKAIDAFHKIKK